MASSSRLLVSLLCAVACFQLCASRHLHQDAAPQIAPSELDEINLLAQTATIEIVPPPEPAAVPSPESVIADIPPGRRQRLFPLTSPIQALVISPEAASAASVGSAAVQHAPTKAVSLSRHQYGSAARAAAAAAAAAAATGQSRAVLPPGIADVEAQAAKPAACSSTQCSIGGSCKLKPVGGCGVGIGYRTSSTSSSVMRTVKLVPMFYGAWTDKQKQIMYNFLYGLGGSTWFGITSLYSDTVGYIGNSKTMFSGQVVNFNSTATYGTTLNDGQVSSLIQAGIKQLLGSSSGGATDAIYLLLTGSDVTQGSSPTDAFCKSYCGWHSAYQVSSSVYIKYAWIGNPSYAGYGASYCLNSCSAQQSPNGDMGVDGMVSVVAHEIAEAASDPLGNTWYDGNGNENADKCAWQFGTAASSNVQFANGAKFLLQTNWNPNTGKCVIGA